MDRVWIFSMKMDNILFVHRGKWEASVLGVMSQNISVLKEYNIK